MVFDAPPAPAPSKSEAATSADDLPEQSVSPAPGAPDASSAISAVTDAGPAGSRIIARPGGRGLFGLASAPYVEGEFVAALRVSSDQWVTVRPKPEGFPNSWQQRILLWFLLSSAIVAPLGYAFARRLTAPLDQFADAAERLGRNPSSEALASDGPAEIGRAARAFNRMQERLRRYIGDRMAMIGAISHDLRTPLARMRFRLERAPDTLRGPMIRDIEQMDATIGSVLVFLRDDAATSDRIRLDLRSVLEVVVDDATLLGAAVDLEPGDPVEVQAEPNGIGRVFANLIDNAVKYGDRARVTLRVEGDDAVVEIEDEGPGLEEAELEQVFQPFHRTPRARATGQSGVGLGLSVSRSIAQAHGGDILLRVGPAGLIAVVRLPMSVEPGPRR